MGKEVCIWELLISSRFGKMQLQKTLMALEPMGMANYGSSKLKWHPKLQRTCLSNITSNKILPMNKHFFCKSFCYILLPPLKFHNKGGNFFR